MRFHIIGKSKSSTVELDILKDSYYHSRSKRAAFSDESRKWTNGVVPYVIDNIGQPICKYIEIFRWEVCQRQLFTKCLKCSMMGLNLSNVTEESN